MQVGRDTFSMSAAGNIRVGKDDHLATADAQQVQRPCAVPPAGPGRRTGCCKRESPEKIYCLFAFKAVHPIFTDKVRKVVQARLRPIEPPAIYPLGMDTSTCRQLNALGS